MHVTAESKDPYAVRATTPPQGILSMQHRCGAAALVEMPWRGIDCSTLLGSFDSPLRVCLRLAQDDRPCGWWLAG